jgi:glucose-6-phosphate isomerase
VTLVAVAAWHAVGGRRSPNRAVACVMVIPALGYAIGTFVTPMYFRPGVSRTENLPQNLMEVALVAGLFVMLGASALASMQEPRSAR